MSGRSVTGSKDFEKKFMATRMRKTNATRERSEIDNILMYFYAAKPDHVIR